MSKQSVKADLIESTSNYIWGRLKTIIVLSILLLIIKNKDADNVIMFFIYLQCFFIFISLLTFKRKLRKKVEEDEKRQRDYNRRYNFNGHFNQQWENYWRQQQQRQQNQQRTTISTTLDINRSAKILGINIIQDNEEIIKKKYRKLAMKWHPDRFSTDTEENQEIAKRNFQKLNNAYIIIKKYKNIN